MNYTEVKIVTTHHEADIICAMLTPFASGFIVDDPQDVVEFSKEKTTKWDYIDDALLGNPERDVTVTLYLDDTEEGKAALVGIKETLAQLRAEQGVLTTLSCGGVKSQDWENNWKQYYKPFNIGERLLIKPSWENVENDSGRTVLTIDPASSFGTGSHATTRLCLLELDGLDTKGKTVLDMGCGSGILAAAMLLLGAEHAYACDIEENAVNTTVENIRKNGIDPTRFSVYQGDVLADSQLYSKLDRGYDIIVANIVADVLKAMCSTLLGWLKPGGVLIISGIIEERKDEVLAYYQEQGGSIESVEVSEGWARIKITNNFSTIIY